MAYTYDEQHAINLSTPRTNFSMFVEVGPFPSRPCDACGNGTFNQGDWNMGYRCTECNTAFGTHAEWEWFLGEKLDS
jgi:hypothetical protein